MDTGGAIGVAVGCCVPTGGTTGVDGWVDGVPKDETGAALVAGGVDCDVDTEDGVGMMGRMVGSLGWVAESVLGSEDRVGDGWSSCEIVSVVAESASESLSGTTASTGRGPGVFMGAVLGFT